MEEPAQRAPSNAFWLVLTPSVDYRGWVNAIHAAANDAGWRVISEQEDGPDDGGPQRLVITDDALHALVARPRGIAAIVAEPGSAPEAVTDMYEIPVAEQKWHASMLLARALSLAPDHRVVTAVELAARPASIALFDALTVVPPPSRAEFPKDAAAAAAFKLYWDVPDNHHDPVEWADSLFTYCPKAADAVLATGVLDITGRPRMLVHGPYLAMPKGRWRGSMRFGVDKDAARHEYRLDWGIRTATISEHATPGQPGLYELTLEFDWTEVDVAEIRVILMEGAFTGSMVFQGMTVSRVHASENVRQPEAA